ncbi:MAG TPA: DUF2079 domain-containing protein [Candidatus Dormibacteraeota bacterium]|nr:DUF2079 domain-containing protein [Candidatus Dormibacteraeota bacterium]
MASEATAQIGVAPREAARIEAWWVYPAVPMLAAAIAFAWFLHGLLLRMYGMTSESWDLAYDQQVIWGLTQGDWFYSSFARANFLGIHLELILLPIAAIEKLWPSPIVLAILSAAGLAASGPAAYLFFRAILPADRKETPWLALALAAPVPFSVAIQEAARDFFHPENMALAFALVAAWAGLRGRRVWMWSFVALALACKEDQVYTVAVLALLMRSYGAPIVQKHWRFLLYVAIFWFLLGTGIVQQHLRAPNGYTDFVYYRWLIHLDPKVPVSTLAVLQALVRPGALLMVGALIASMFGLPLLAPRWLLLVIPPYLANVLSEHVPQNTLNLHYVLLLMFPLMVAGGVGARRFLERVRLRPALAVVVALPALILAWGYGGFPPALQGWDWAYSRPNAVAQLQGAASVIPPDAPVNADSGLDIWLANRHTINDFPDMLAPDCYVVIDQQAYYLGSNTDPAKHKAALDALPASGRRLLYDDGRFQVWSPVGD